VTTRRTFINLLCGAAGAWPLTARAQQPPKIQIGVLAGFAEDDPESAGRRMTFAQAMQKLGWTDGDNVHLEFRWGGSDTQLISKYAAELIALAPSVILASGTVALRALQQATNKIPIVFVNVSDPVREGFVSNLFKPSGNITGFTAFEFSMAGKWLELLKDIAPRTAAAMVMFDPKNATAKGHIETLESAAKSVGTKLTHWPVASQDEIEHAIGTFGAQENRAMIVLPGPVTNVNRQLIALLAARHRIPAVYPYRFYAAAGGLMSYGINTLDLFRRAAVYIDRILHGEEPGSMPVQQPVEFELVLNLRAAKVIGIEIPPNLLARADEVIE
jgi:putative ABC transport system substrate-binding protein